MSTTINYVGEALVTDLFSEEFINRVHKYLGLDPNVDAEYQPLKVTDLIKSAVATVEKNQNRILLVKEVTIRPPVLAFCNPDNKVFLPYGVPHSAPVVTYQPDPEVAAETVTGLLFNDKEPCYLWSKEWTEFLTEDNPDPVEIVYTVGYSTEAEIPKSTLTAIEVYCHFMFNREDAQEAIPDAFWHHCFLDQLNYYRLEDLI
jgi:hypothetical protein